MKNTPFFPGAMTPKQHIAKAVQAFQAVALTAVTVATITAIALIF